MELRRHGVIGTALTEEAHAFAVMLDGLDAEGRRNMGFSRAGAADQHHILGAIQEFAAMKLGSRPIDFRHLA